MSNSYKDAVIYQIYPRSFCDTNRDGIGDIPGIISKLDYLADLGVDVIWLSPVYKSPNDDNGYDISDYCSIHPDFGTMEDFDTLIAEAKARGIRIIMDLVINHTSDEHEWFQRALAGEEKYRNYYIIRKGRDGDEPNNWGNFFAMNPWDRFGDPKNNEYYLHLFSKKQPDLNWHNPEVYEEICGVMRFWLEKGVAGFRCDVINVIYKDSLADGKKQLALTGIEHYLSKEGCHDILRRLRADVLEPYGAFTVGETVMVDIAKAKDLCDPERRELDMVFAFEHMECDQIGVKWFKTRFKPEKLMKCLTKWQNGLDWNTCYFENHDQPRSVSRFGDDGKYRVRSAQMLGGLILSLRGTPFLYEGQEIGMTNGDFANLDEIMDIESHTVDAMMQKLHIVQPFRWNLIRQTSRDNARTPMQWSGEQGAGFTAGKPWLQINRNYPTVNVEADRASEDGVYAFYKKMIAFRKASAVLLEGGFEELYAKGSVYVFDRSLEGETLTAAFNFSAKERPMPVQAAGSVIMGNYPDGAAADAPLRAWEFRLIDRNAEVTTEEAVQEAAETPDEEPAQEAVVAPDEKPVQEAAETPDEEPVQEAAVTPGEEAVQETAEKPAEEPEQEAKEE